MSKKGSDRTRRNVLKSTGAALLGTSIVGAGSASGTSDTQSGRFVVTGTMEIVITFGPDNIVVTQELFSEDLERRYGDQSVVFEETIARADPAADDYPRDSKRTASIEWSGRYAKEDEWISLYSGDSTTQKQTASSSTSTSLSEHALVEDDYLFGVYEYKADGDGGYMIVAPMNVHSPDTVSEVSNVLTSNGYTGIVVQYNRSAYNTDTNQFVQQDNTVATSSMGITGRKHARMWQFGGYASISAHVDDEFFPDGHTAKSFADAEADIRGIFDAKSGWDTTDDRYDLDNDLGLPLSAPDDHDGMSTEVSLIDSPSP